MIIKNTELAKKPDVCVTLTFTKFATAFKTAPCNSIFLIPCKSANA